MAGPLPRVTNRPTPAPCTAKSAVTVEPPGAGSKAKVSSARNGPNEPISTHRSGQVDSVVRIRGRTPGTTVMSVQVVPTAVASPSTATTSATARSDDCQSGRLRGSAR